MLSTRCVLPLLAVIATILLAPCHGSPFLQLRQPVYALIHLGNYFVLQHEDQEPFPEGQSDREPFQGGQSDGEPFQGVQFVRQPFQHEQFEGEQIEQDEFEPEQHVIEQHVRDAVECANKAQSGPIIRPHPIVTPYENDQASKVIDNVGSHTDFTDWNAIVDSVRGEYTSGQYLTEFSGLHNMVPSDLHVRLHANRLKMVKPIGGNVKNKQMQFQNQFGNQPASGGSQQQGSYGGQESYGSSYGNQPATGGLQQQGSYGAQDNFGSSYGNQQYGNPPNYNNQGGNWPNQQHYNQPGHSQYNQYGNAQGNPPLYNQPGGQSYNNPGYQGNHQDSNNQPHANTNYNPNGQDSNNGNSPGNQKIIRGHQQNSHSTAIEANESNSQLTRVTRSLEDAEPGENKQESENKADDKQVEEQPEENADKQVEENAEEQAEEKPEENTEEKTEDKEENKRKSALKPEPIKDLWEANDHREVIVDDTPISPEALAHAEQFQKQLADEKDNIVEKMIDHFMETKSIPEWNSPLDAKRHTQTDPLLDYLYENVLLKFAPQLADSPLTKKRVLQLATNIIGNADNALDITDDLYVF